LRDAAEAHRRIYQAIRGRDAEAARAAMNEHLLQASAYQAQEGEDAAVVPGADVKAAAKAGNGKARRRRASR
jgi:hypothetical protein